MNAKELMIDDWVAIRDDRDPLYYEIGQINQLADYGNTIVVNGTESLAELIEPIAIDAQILDANGFRYTNLDNYCKIVTNDVFPTPFSIEYNTANKSLFINDGLVPTPVLYVHQLQHVFRLCGIVDFYLTPNN